MMLSNSFKGYLYWVSANCFQVQLVVDLRVEVGRGVVEILGRERSAYCFEEVEEAVEPEPSYYAVRVSDITVRSFPLVPEGQTCRAHIKLNLNK